MMSRRQSRRNQTSKFTEDGFYSHFFKMLGYFYGNIVGLEGASVLRSDQPCRRCVIKGDEFNRRLRRGRQRQPAAAAGQKNGARHCPPRRRASNASCQ